MEYIFFDASGIATSEVASVLTVIVDTEGDGSIEVRDPHYIFDSLDRGDLAEKIRQILQDRAVDDVLRPAMDRLDEAWRAYISRYASAPLGFSGPHCGVHVRKWRNPYNSSGWSEPVISIECDPGYCGIGAAMEPGEARKLGEALLRAACVAEEAE